MYICLCQGVTDRDITDLLQQGGVGMRQLRQQLKVGSQCGRCTCTVRQMVNSFYQIAEPGESSVIPLSSAQPPRQRVA
ncbi:(2Fe-2S)-binding protein [Pseudaeromonas sharmana]|uniref:Bacterioferritin-associated ferredoxin n=1 Tax=Pseudaeromonas sharmana TaxID=328412 RepID=A0ABV8CLE9_9GAMM